MKRFIRVTAFILSTIMFMLCINIVPTQSYAATDNVEDNGVTISFADKANRTVYKDDQQVWEQNGIIVTNDKAGSATNVTDYANPIRLYQYSNLTVEYPGMTKLIFNCPAPDNGKDRTEGLVAVLQTMSSLTYTQDGYVITVDLAEATDILKIDNLKYQVRIKEITVYTEPTGGNGGTTEPTEPAPADPTEPAEPNMVVSTEVTASKTVVQPGEEFELEANICCAMLAHSFGIKMQFNDDVFELISGECTVAGAMVANYNGKGWAAMFASATAYSGQLGTAIVRVKEDAPFGIYSINFQPSVKNGDLSLDAVSTSLSVRIGCEHVTSGEITKPATCTDLGEMTYSCSICNYSYVDACIPATGHIWQDEKCSSCGILGGICGDHVFWTLDNNGVMQISGTGKMDDYSWDVPWYKYKNQIVNVCIENGVGNVCAYAFYRCNNLRSVHIPDSITSIGDYAFDSCYALTELILPDSVTEIGYSSFAYCKNIAHLTLSQNITDISDCAFQECNSLTSVAIPANVKYIGVQAFAYCTSLTSLTIPKNVENIGTMAFFECKNLNQISVDTNNEYYSNDSYGVLFDKNQSTLIYAPGNLTGQYIIPQTVYNVVYAAFWNCKGLTSIVVPQGVATVEDSAFFNCNNLKNVIYCGSEEQWNSIAVGNYNTSLTDASRQYHDYQTKVTEPTCTERGYTTHTCMYCKSVYVDTYKDELGHTVVIDSAKETSCTQDGLTEGKHCATCGEILIAQTIIPASGHNGGVWVEIIPVTCTTGGLNARICDVCGETETASTAALGHSFEIFVTESTCTEQGYTTKTCSVCGMVEIVDYVPAKGHKWSAWITTVNPTCTLEGSQMRFCNCGTKETQMLPKLAHSYVDGVCSVCNQIMGGYVILSTDMNLSRLTLTEDLYIDLNGYDLSGTIELNGFKVYAMDSATNEYTCDIMGYFSCVDENGNAIVPERQYVADNGMRYLTIATENGYTFHRYYLGITNISLAPSVTGFGYKAEFYGDEMVQSQIESIGYNLWLTEDRVVSRTADFKNSLTLRLKNFDVANYGNVLVNACVTITLTDGTVITGAPHSHTLQQALETVNSHYADFTASQLAAVSAMIEANPVMQTWQVENIYKKEI